VRDTPLRYKNITVTSDMQDVPVVRRRNAGQPGAGTLEMASPHPLRGRYSAPRATVKLEETVEVFPLGVVCLTSRPV